MVVSSGCVDYYLGRTSAPAFVEDMYSHYGLLCIGNSMRSMAEHVAKNRPMGPVAPPSTKDESRTIHFYDVLLLHWRWYTRQCYVWLCIGWWYKRQLWQIVQTGKRARSPWLLNILIYYTQGSRRLLQSIRSRFRPLISLLLSGLGFLKRPSGVRPDLFRTTCVVSARMCQDMAHPALFLDARQAQVREECDTGTFLPLPQKRHCRFHAASRPFFSFYMLNLLWYEWCIHMKKPTTQSVAGANVAPKS